jgi:type I restriction enzyme M protein
MVLKKKDGKEVEIQEGWKGRIMPFNLVQKAYLQEELVSIQKKENRLVEITANYEEILEALNEEEKEEDTVNEAKDAFVNAEVIKAAKQIRADSKKNGAVAKDSYESNILKVDKLIAEEKETKNQLKVEKDKLHLLTKSTIETLEQEQVYELLELKWINPVVSSLINLPKTSIDKLTTTVQTIADKYNTTYSDVAKQIKEAENALSSLIGELEGNEFDMQGLNEFKNLLHG